MSDDVNKSNNIMSLPTVLNPNNPFYSDCFSADNAYFSDFTSMSSDYDEAAFSRHFISNYDRRNSIHNLSNYAMQYTLLHPPVQETSKLSKQELPKSVPQKNPFSNDNFVQDLKIKQDDEQIEPIVVVENSNDPLFPEIKFNSKLLAIFSIPEQMAMLKKVLDEAKLKKQEALDKKVEPWIKLSNQTNQTNQTNSTKSNYITINKNPTKSPDNFRFVQSSLIRAPKSKEKVDETKDSSSDSDFPDSNDPERMFKIRKMLHKIFFKGGKLPTPRSNLIEPDFKKLALETIYSKYDDFLSKYKKSTEEQKTIKK